MIWPYDTIRYDMPIFVLRPIPVAFRDSSWANSFPPAWLCSDTLLDHSGQKLARLEPMCWYTERFLQTLLKNKDKNKDKDKDKDKSVIL